MTSSRLNLGMGAALVALTATAALTGSAGASPGRSAQACAAATGRSITGTLRGADGKALDALIGFDLTDAAGRKVNAADGCPVRTYGARVRLNSGTAAGGSATGTTRFTVSGLPANATTLYAEVYLKDASGNNTSSRYGWVVRQRVPITARGVSLKLVAPLLASTGRIEVITTHPVSHVLAFSQAPASTVSQGWADITSPTGSPTTYVLTALAASQSYVVLVPGAPYRGGVRVVRGRTTVIRIAN